MRNKTQNQTPDRALINQTKALTNFLTTVDPSDVKLCLHDMFVAYIPTEWYSDEEPTRRHDIIFVYYTIVEFLSKLSYAPGESKLKADDALKALKELTDQIEPEQAKDILRIMFNTYITTDDYCDSMDIERFGNVFHINTTIDFFSEFELKN